MNNIVDKLKEFGFNSYEAKVYLALLKKFPSTGYEVSQNADIPQSRAYDALKSLLSDGYIFSNNEKPLKYSPISPKELTQRFKRKLNSSIDFLEKKLPKVTEDYDEPIHIINSHEDIYQKIREIIDNSTQSLYLEIWAEDFKTFEKNIENAYDRGVSIKIVGYDNLNTVMGTVYQHAGAKDYERTFGSRLIFILSDNKESVFGKIDGHLIWTKNMDIAFLLKEFIVHDMYLLDVYANFPEQLKYFYGAGFKKLKEKILDKHSSYNIH